MLDPNASSRMATKDAMMQGGLNVSYSWDFRRVLQRWLRDIAGVISVARQNGAGLVARQGL